MNTTIRKVIQRGFIILLLATVIQSANAAIVVSTGATTGATYSAGTYTCNSTSAVINVTELQGYLASTNVVIDGTSQGTDVTVSNAISWSSAFSLTIKSRQSFTLSAAITNGGSGAVTLLAAQGAAGSLFVNANVTTNNGAIKLYQGVDASGTQRNFTGGVGIATATASTIQSNGGDITIQNSTSGSVDATFTGAGIYFAGAGATVNAGTGSININGYGQSSGSQRSNGIFIDGTTTIQASGSGNITLYGQSKNSVDWSDGIVFASNNYDLHTENGNIQLSGTGGANTGYYAFGITFQGTATTKIYSTTGNITLKGYSNATSYAAIRKHNAGSTIYIGTNNSGITTSGNITMLGDVVGASNQLFTTAGGNFVLKGTGNLTIGSDAASSGNSGITIASGMLSTTSWKNVSIGDVRTAGVMVQDNLTTNAASTTGISIISKSWADINAALSTTTGSTAPITVLGAQGVADNVKVNANITTYGGAINIAGGCNADGSVNYFASTVNVANTVASAINSNGGNISIRNTSLGGRGAAVLPSRGSGIHISDGAVASFNAGGGNITITGYGTIGSTDRSGGIFFNGFGTAGANTTSVITSGTGNIAITGIGGTQSGTGLGSGILFNTNAYDIHTSGSGSVTVDGRGSPTGTASCSGVAFYGTGGSTKIYSATGATNIYGKSNLSTVAAIEMVNGHTVSIGHDGGSTITSGDITLYGDVAAVNANVFYNAGVVTIKGTGNLTIGSNPTGGTGNNGLTLASGVVSGTGAAWKKISIGDVRTGIVNINDNLVNVASGDNITVIGKQDVNIANPITNNASGKGIYLLSTQGTDGRTRVKANLTTNNGPITVYAGKDITGTDVSTYHGQVCVFNGTTINSGTGDINIANTINGSTGSQFFETSGVQFNTLLSTGNDVSRVATGVPVVNGGNITVKGYGRIVAALEATGIDIAQVDMTASGNILLDGTSGDQATSASSGIRFLSAGSTTYIATQKIRTTGVGSTITINALGRSSANSGLCFWTDPGITTNVMIYNTNQAGAININGLHNNGSGIAMNDNYGGSTSHKVYIGWDNGSNVTTGDINFNLVGGGATTFAKTYIKTNGGNVKIGDYLGNSLGALTLNSGTIDATGSYKSFTIGGLTTSGVTINTPLTTSAASTAGIAITSKGAITTNGTLSTSAATGAPITVLAAQGAGGGLTTNAAITTNNGAVTLYSGCNAAGTDLGKVAFTQVFSNVTSGGGAINIYNSIGSTNTNLGVRIDGSSPIAINSGAGDITMKGYTMNGERGLFLRNASLTTTTGAINLTGTNAGNAATYNAGVFIDNGNNGPTTISTTSGAINITGYSNSSAGTQWGPIAAYNDAVYDVKIYSTSGSISMNGINNTGGTGSPLFFVTNTGTKYIYIGYDGSSAGTTGNITLRGGGGTGTGINIPRIKLKSNGGDVIIGDNGSVLGVLTLNSGTIDATGSYKSFYIGGTNSSAVTINAPLNTNATSTAGIQVTSKTDATINAALSTTTGSTAPITVLAAQGAAGLLTVNNTITTQGGDILAYSGRTAATTGYNTGFAGQFNLSGISNMHSNGGNINIKTGDGATVTGGRNTLSQIIDAGGGNIDIYGKANAIAVYPVNSDIKTSGSGSVKIYGVLAAGTDFAGMLFDGTTNRITTVDGGITLTGDGTTTMRGIGVYTGTATVTSTTGAITMTGLNTSAFHAIEVGVNGAATLNVGYDGTTGAGTTGNITINGSATGTGSIYLGDGSTKKTFIKSNGGAVTIGDNGSALGGLTLNSGTIISSTNGYKSFTIGGVNTSGVEVNSNLATNATADAAIGITLKAKGTVTFGIANNISFDTSAKTGVPVNVLAGRGGTGTIFGGTWGGYSATITTNNAPVNLFAGGATSASALGANVGSTHFKKGSITTGGGAVSLIGGVTGECNEGTYIQNTAITTNGGDIILRGKGISTTTGFSEGVVMSQLINLNSGAGNIVLAGTAGVGTTHTEGIRFGEANAGNTISLQTTTGNIDITGDAASAGGGTLPFGIWFYQGNANNGYCKFYSTSGNITFNAMGGNDHPIIYSYDGAWKAQNIYIGWDGTSGNGTTGDINFNLATKSATHQRIWSSNNGTFAIKGQGNLNILTKTMTGGAISPLTLYSGMVVGTLWKSINIGDINTKSLDLYGTYQLGTTGSTAGINFTAASDITVEPAAVVHTAFASGLPITVLAVQGNGSGALTSNASITTNNGEIKLFAGRAADGTQTGYGKFSLAGTSTIASNGGNISVKSGSAYWNSLRSGIATTTMNAGGGNIDIYACASGDLGLDLWGGNAISTNGTGTINIMGESSLAIGSTSSSGIMVESASGTDNKIFTANGDIAMTGNAPGYGMNGWDSGILKVYSTAGNINMTGNASGAGGFAFYLGLHSLTQKYYIGFDGTIAAGTTGNITIKGKGTGGMSFNNNSSMAYIKSNGGAVTVGDNGTDALGAITLPSGAVDATGNYKSFTIGGVNTSGVIVATPLTTNAASTAGILVTSKSWADINAALATTTGSSAPIAILSAQGATADLKVNANITTYGGKISLLGGVAADGVTDTYASSVVIANSANNILASNGGDIVIRNNKTLGGTTANVEGVGICTGFSSVYYPIINAGGGNITMAGYGAASSSMRSSGVMFGSYGAAANSVTTQVKTSGAGNISITGEGKSATTWGSGIFFDTQNYEIFTTGSGSVTLDGKGASPAPSNGSGILIYDNGSLKVYSLSGPTNVKGYSLLDNSGIALKTTTCKLYIGNDGGSTNITSGDITIYGDCVGPTYYLLNANGSIDLKIKGTGNLTIGSNPAINVGNNGMTIPADFLSGSLWKSVTLGDVRTKFIALNDNLTTTTNGINITAKTDISGSGNMVANGQNITITTTPTSLGAAAYTGAITGTANLVRLGTGFDLITESGNVFLMTGTGNTFTGTTTITSGELRLNPSADVSNWASPLVMNGGRLSTMGIFAGRSWTSTATLTVSETSKIKLENNVHQLHFANSTGTTWLSTAMLGIDGWKGSYGTSGFKGRFYMSNAPGGLNPEQVTNTRFKNIDDNAYYVSTCILGDGEVVPYGLPSTFETTQTGNYESSTTWGKSGTAVWGLTYPGITNDFTIAADHIVAINSTNDYSSGTVTIAGTGGLTLTGMDTHFGAINSATASTITLTSGTLTIGDSGNLSSAFAGTISGTGGITKDGTGMLTLSGTSTNSGATTIAKGTIKLESATAASAASTVTIANTANALFDLNGYSATIGGLSGGGATGGWVINNGSADATLTFGSNNAATTYAGIIKNGTTNKTAVVKAGTGTTIFSGVNTYTGGTTINGGQLTVAAVGGLPNNANSPVIVNAGTFNAAVSDIFGTDFVNVVTPVTINLGGTVTNSGTYYSLIGPLNMNGGTLTSVGGNSTTYPSWGLGGAVTVTDNSTISATGTNAGINLGSATTISTVPFDVAAGKTLTVSAKLQNGASITSKIAKNGTGTMLISGDNTYDKATLNSGILKLGSAGNGSSGPLGTSSVNLYGGYLDLNGFSLGMSKSLYLYTLSGGGMINSSSTAATWSGTVGFGAGPNPASIISTGNILLTSTSQLNLYSGSTLVLDGTAMGSSLANQLSNTLGAGNLEKTGTGIWTLTNAGNSYLGTTTITQGELRLNPTANATFASQVIMNGGTLGTANIALNRTHTSSSTLKLAASSTLALGSNAHTLTFANSSAVSWAEGVLTITGWQGAFNSTTGTAGKLVVGGATGALTVTQLAQIRFLKAADSKYYAATQLGTGEVVATGTLFGKTWTGATSTDWNVATNWVPQSVPIASDDVIIPTGLTNYPIIGAAGGTCNDITVNGGSLTINSTGTLNGGTYAGNISIASGLYLNLYSTADQVLSGVISGAGLINKNNTGTLILSGNNTFSGIFKIYDGTVKLGSAGSGANGPLGTTANETSIMNDSYLDLNGYTLATAEPIRFLGGKLINSSAVAVTYSGLLSFNASDVNAGMIATGNIMLTGSTFDLLSGGTLTLDGTSTGSSIANQIINSGGTACNLTKTGTGSWTLTNTANSYSGTTTVTEGELRLNPSGNATFASQVVMNGGTLSTAGITATRTFTSSVALNMTASSTLALGSNAHTLTFANSSAVSWSTGVLTITGWQGSFNSTAGTNAKLFVGSGTGALTATQLSMIRIYNTADSKYYTAAQLGTGEVVATATLFGKTWTGATSTNWNVASNWAPSGVPAITDDITIPTGLTNYPVIGAAGGTCANIAINGGSLTIATTGRLNGGVFAGTISIALGTNFNCNSSASQSISGVISGAGAFTKNGTGTLTLSGDNTYSGVTNFNTGTVKLGSAGTASSGPLGSITQWPTLNGILDLNGFTPNFTEIISIGAGTIINSSSIPATYKGGIHGSTSIGFNSSVGDIFITYPSLNLLTGATLTLSGVGTGSSISSSIANLSGTSNLTKTGTGTWTLSNPNNSYIGTTTITQGELRLNPTANATFASQVVLNGGTLGTTGIAATSFTSTSTLNMTASSTLALGSAVHTLTFADSRAVSWSTGVLTITGWTGAFDGTAGTSAKLFVGSDAGGLTAAQLAMIKFENSGQTYSAIQLSTGEVVAGTSLFVSVQTGNWNDPATWGKPAGSVEGVNYPGATDAVTVSAGHTVTLTAAANGGKLTCTGNLSLGTYNLTFGSLNGVGNINMGTATLSRSIANDGHLDASTFDGVMSGAGNLTLAEGGIFTITKSQTFTGTTTLSTATIKFNPTAVTMDWASPIVLNDGSLSTEGIAANATVTSSSTLAVNGYSSEIKMDEANVHSLKFANSSTQSISLIAILGWQGGFNSQPGSMGRLYFGTASGGLSDTQLSNMYIYKSSSDVDYPVIQLATGEVVAKIYFHSVADGDWTAPATWDYSGTPTAGVNYPGTTNDAEVYHTVGLTDDVVTSGAVANDGIINFNGFDMSLGAISLNGTYNLGTSTLTLTGSTDYGISGRFNGAGQVIKQGAGTFTSDFGGDMATNFKVEQGVLSFKPYLNGSTYSGQLEAAGGTISFNAGFTSSSTLQLTNNSTLALDNAATSITFSNTSGVSWTSGKALTITNWTGTFDGVSSGTTGKLYFGGDNTGLSAAQLKQIRFLNTADSKYYTATQLGTGEVVATATLFGQSWILITIP